MVGVLFMLRFLFAICGPEGKAAPVAYMARFAPEHDGPSGCEADRNQKSVIGEMEHVLTRAAWFPFMRYEAPRRGWRGLAARPGHRTGSRG